MDALCSKAASFGVGDLGQTHISKAVEEISQVLPELWTTSVQAEPVVEDVPMGKSEEVPADAEGSRGGEDFFCYYW